MFVNELECFLKSYRTKRVSMQPAVAIFYRIFIRPYMDMTGPFVRYFLPVAVNAEDALPIRAHEVVTEIMHD